MNVVQPATFVTKPVSPKKKLWLVLGAMCGLMGSFGIAVFAEYFDQTLTTPEQVEENLQLPVLMTVRHDEAEAKSQMGRGRS